jgi:uncharacterized protein YkwD
MKFKFLIGIVLALFISGTAVAAVSWVSGTVNQTAQDQLISLIKAEHDRVCSNSLSHNSQLVWAARYKAQDMVYRGYFSHASPDGKYIRQFYNRAGISWSSSAEILAYNSLPDSSSAKGAFNQFMNSTPHRNVIRSCTYTRFGVGVFKNKAGRKYYAVEFTRP